MVAVPVFVSTTWPWNPPDHALTTEYAAWQDNAGDEGELDADADADVLADAEAEPVEPVPLSGNWIVASSDCLAALTGVGS